MFEVLKSLIKMILSGIALAAAAKEFMEAIKTMDFIGDAWEFHPGDK